MVFMQNSQTYPGSEKSLLLTGERIWLLVGFASFQSAIFRPDINLVTKFSILLLQKQGRLFRESISETNTYGNIRICPLYKNVSQFICRWRRPNNPRASIIQTCGNFQ